MRRDPDRELAKTAAIWLAVMTFAIVLLLALVLLGGCGPQWNGASAPTEDTHPIPIEVLDIATDPTCDITSLTGKHADDLKHMKSKLKNRGVVIKPRRRPRGKSVAVPFVLSVPLDFPDRDKDSQVRSLAHEDTHYCQLENFDEFYALWLRRSDYRWAFETMADGASWRAAVVQGFTPTDEAMRENAKVMRHEYWLYDLDETQFFTETLNTWKDAVAR